MKVAMMQPTFLPWLGYFELIAKSEVFVFLDDFQFVYQSYHQKNRLFTNKNQVDWYVVPIDKKESFQKPLSKAVIKESMPWRKKCGNALKVIIKDQHFILYFKRTLWSCYYTQKKACYPKILGL